MSRRGGGGGEATAAVPTESTQLLSSAGGGGIRQPFDATTMAMAQPPHRHAQMHEAAEAIDPVERLVKHALTGTAIVLFLVFLGVLFLVLKALGFDRLPVLARLPPALHSYWAVFTPFWLADLVLLALLAEVLHGIFTLRATSRAEKRNMARIPPARRPPQYDKIVSMEMFPLVQTLLRGALAALPLLACAIAAQVLFCLRLEGVAPISVWQALLPVLVYEALALLGALCLRHGSWQQGLAWGLALLSTLALALRLSPDAWPPSAGTSWAALRPLWVAFTPLWALESFLLLLLLHVALQAGRCVRRYKLNAQHLACMVMYTLSLLLFAGAQALIAWDRALEDALDGAFPSLADGVDDARGRHSSSSSSSSSSSDVGRSSSSAAAAAAAHKEPPPLPPPSGEQPAAGGLADALAGIALFCGVGLLCLALFLVAEERADYLVTSHGYEDPLPLSRTAKGWEPTGARFSSWLLLGRVEETARLMRGGARAGAVGMATAAMQAAMGGRGGLQGQGGARRDLDASPAGPELKRSNSGSYADLYADL